LAADTGTVTVRCPMLSHGHPDRTPSMRLYLDTDRYYCFGCPARGDVVQWARDTEQTGVTLAIRALGSGVPLTNVWAGQPTDPGGTRRIRTVSAGREGLSEPVSQAETPNMARTPPDRVYAALAAAWDYYTFGPLHARATLYLATRGLQVGVLEAHTGRAEAGHTPVRADGLVTALTAKGFTTDELVDAGLAHRRLGGSPLTDFYRQRVLIPVRDDQHRVVGIIGRNVGDQDRWPKYKNPPRTHAYDKSIDLYQPLPAPADAHGHVVVVEGTLDAMAIAIAAIRTGKADQFCPVTQSGRELSPAQLNQILTMHPADPILGFDGDAAGREATYRYAVEGAHRGRRVAVMILPDDHDPASWLAEHGDVGLEAWRSDGIAPSLVVGGSLLAAHLAQTQLAPMRRTNNITWPPLRAGRIGRCSASELPTEAAATADERMPL
jgi:DNA primase